MQTEQDQTAIAILADLVTAFLKLVFNRSGLRLRITSPLKLDASHLTAYGWRYAPFQLVILSNPFSWNRLVVVQLFLIFLHHLRDCIVISVIQHSKYGSHDPDEIKYSCLFASLNCTTYHR